MTTHCDTHFIFISNIGGKHCKDFKLYLDFVHFFFSDLILWKWTQTLTCISVVHLWKSVKTFLISGKVSFFCTFVRPLDLLYHLLGIISWDLSPLATDRDGDPLWFWSDPIWRQRIHCGISDDHSREAGCTGLPAVGFHVSLLSTSSWLCCLVVSGALSSCG